jgi:hypothetical protein
MSKRAAAVSFILAAACFFYAARSALEWQRIIDGPPGGPRVISRGQPTAAGVPVYSGAYQSIRPVGSAYSIEYRFVNFNKDNLWVQFNIAKAALDATAREFGYYQQDLDALSAQYQRAVDMAKQDIGDFPLSPAQKAEQMQTLEQNYKRKRADYLASKGFKFMSDDTLEIDMPKLVQRNTPRLQTLAQAFSNIAREKNYDSEDVIGGVTAMVETALYYKEPPKLEGARNIDGLLPPLESLIAGWGDCDTKTGVLASILKNWDGIRAIGVALPTHYLMGIYQIPRHGDVYIEYGGLDYVLIDPAGPAWLPIGTVSQDTMGMLQARDGMEIDQF